ncbi:MAG: Vps62-related protein [Oligoflexus sp.]
MNFAFFRFNFDAIVISTSDFKLYASIMKRDGLLSLTIPLKLGKDQKSPAPINQELFLIRKLNKGDEGNERTLKLGAHDADWKRIAAKIKRGQLDQVMFYQHSGHYTKKPGNMQILNGTRPVVYVRKNSHDSYHDAGGTGSCLYFEDYRSPGSADLKMETWKNLIHLTDGTYSPDWMRYRGSEYWDGLTGPLARGVTPCGMDGCRGKDFNIGNTLCFVQCGCAKSDISDRPF